MSIQHNIADLNSALAAYRQLSGKTDQEILSKQGGKLAREIKFALFDTAKPAKGIIRAELMDRLRSGRVVKVRPSIVDWAKALTKTTYNISKKKAVETGRKRVALTWWQRAIQREIGIRESGRKFLGVTSRYPSTLEHGQKSISKLGTILSEAGVKLNQTGGAASITWSGLSKQSKQAVEAFGRPIPKAAVKKAIHETTEDILNYVRPRQHRLVVQAVRQMIKQRK